MALVEIDDELLSAIELTAAKIHVDPKKSQSLLELHAQMNALMQKDISDPKSYVSDWIISCGIMIFRRPPKRVADLAKRN